MCESQSINPLDNELQELEAKRQEAKIHYMALFYDKGSFFYNDAENLEFNHESIDETYNQLRKDIIEYYRKQNLEGDYDRKDVE